MENIKSIYLAKCDIHEVTVYPKGKIGHVHEIRTKGFKLFGKQIIKPKTFFNCFLYPKDHTSRNAKTRDLALSTFLSMYNNDMEYEIDKHDDIWEKARVYITTNNSYRSFTRYFETYDEAEKYVESLGLDKSFSKLQFNSAQL